ncbi:MAG TPA: hypothetical protein VES60_01140 [Nakamurella sp.]|nr:hypothetical protein [Nakamurella sp.]
MVSTLRRGGSDRRDAQSLELLARYGCASGGPRSSSFDAIGLLVVRFLRPQTPAADCQPARVDVSDRV